MGDRPIRVSILGLWGLNLAGLSFGGFEAAYSELAVLLAESGYEMTVYCRQQCYPVAVRPRNYRGVELVYVPTINTKNLSFPVATTLALLRVLLRRRDDVLLFVNVGSGFHCVIARLFGYRTILNVDGLDWERPKWGSFAKFYFTGALSAALLGCDVLLTDCRAMADVYLTRFGRALDVITYGARLEDSREATGLADIGLNSGSFYLVVTRIIPDNNLHKILEAFKCTDTARQLIVVGDANYYGPYQRAIYDVNDSRVKFLGRVHDQGILSDLYRGCRAYIHGHAAGGTNPALLRALATGAPALAFDTPSNREVLDQGRAGLLWTDAAELAQQLASAEADETWGAELRSAGQRRIVTHHDWNDIVRQYVRLFDEVRAGRSECSFAVRYAPIALCATGMLLSAILLWSFVR